MSKTVQIVLGLVVIVLVAAGSFYGGMLYGKQQANATAVLPRAGFDPGQPGAFGPRGQRGSEGGFSAPAGMTFGQIDEIDSEALLVTDANGKQTRVQVTATTLIEKNASVGVGDLEIGETVIVSGSDNADGSITARSIQVGAPGRLGGGQLGGASQGQ